MPCADGRSDLHDDGGASRHAAEQDEAVWGEGDQGLFWRAVIPANGAFVRWSVFRRLLA